MSVATIIMLVTVLVPMLTELIKWAETSQQPGAVKKQNVMDLFTSIWSSLAGANVFGKDLQGVTTEQATGAASGIIDMLVSLFNATGIFKPTSPAPPAPGA